MANRNKRQSLALRAKIRDLWILGYNTVEIADKLTRDGDKISPEWVSIHVKKIEADLEHGISEDAIDKYASEFVRMRASFDNEITEMTRIIDKLSDEDPKELEAKIKLINARHAVRTDKVKMLQDVELVLAVKKYKQERSKWSGKLVEVKEDPKIEMKFLEVKKDYQEMDKVVG